MHDIPPRIDWAAWIGSPDFPANPEPTSIGHVLYWAVQALKHVEPQVTLAHLAVFSQSEPYRVAILTQIQDQEIGAW